MVAGEETALTCYLSNLQDGGHMAIQPLQEPLLHCPDTGDSPLDTQRQFEWETQHIAGITAGDGEEVAAGDGDEAADIRRIRYSLRERVSHGRHRRYLISTVCPKSAGHKSQHHLRRGGSEQSLRPTDQIHVGDGLPAPSVGCLVFCTRG